MFRRTSITLILFIDISQVPPVATFTPVQISNSITSAEVRILICTYETCEQGNTTFMDGISGYVISDVSVMIMVTGRQKGLVYL
jgi:hypothetical protein